MGISRVRQRVGAFVLLAGVLQSLLLWAADIAAPWLERPRPAPADLRLTPKNAATAEALAHYAWGLHLRSRSRNPEADAASAEFLAALRRDPEAEPALNALIAPWIVRRDFARIVRVLQPLAKAHPKAVALQLVVAEALGAQKKLPRAIALLERSLMACKWRDPKLFRQLFVYYWQEKQFDKIQTLLRRVRNAADLRDRFVVLHANAVYCNARAHAANGRKNSRLRRRCEKSALEWARRAAAVINAQVRPQDAISLARIFIERGHPDEAATMLRRYHRFHVAHRRPEITLLLAGILLDLKKREAAITLLDPMLRHSWLTPRAAVELGRLYLQAEALDKAAVAYEKALILRPNLSRLRLTLAYLYLRMNRPKRAIELVQPLDELPAQRHYLLSHAFHQLHRLKKAGRELMLAALAARKAHDKRFFSVDYFLYSATLLEDMGLTDRAVQEAEKALHMMPDDPTCLNFVGYVLADHNRDLDRAERLIRRAVMYEPGNVAFLDSLAWVLYRKHRIPEALAEMNHCLDLSGSEVDPIILEHAGDISEAAGYPILARRYWWDALESGAEPTDAARIRKKLDRRADRKTASAQAACTSRSQSSKISRAHSE